MSKVVLFGTRSPLLPDYEEACGRAGLHVAASVKVDALRPRILDRSTLIEFAGLGEGHKGQPFLACAFSPVRREELANMAIGAGLVAAEPLLDPAAVVASSTRAGSGSFFNAGVVIGSAGLVGEHVFVNRSTNLGHHVFVEDFVSIGPGVTMAGNVRLGRQAFVGAGSIVLPGVRIGERAVVAAGSVVRKNVPSGVLVAGNPAIVKQQQLSPTVYGQPGEE